MFQGKVFQALKYVDSNSNVTGVCDTSNEVLETLKQLHPDASPVNDECIVATTSEKVEPVIFEEITADLVADIARNLSGSGGTTQMYSDGWKHILCNKSFSRVSSSLCQAIADLTKLFCSEDVNH